MKQTVKNTEGKWKIFINAGTAEEYEKLDNMSFLTKESAKAYCREGIAMPSGKVYHYPQKCIVSRKKYNELHNI